VDEWDTDFSDTTDSLDWDLMGWEWITEIADRTMNLSFPKNSNPTHPSASQEIPVQICVPKS